MAGQVGLAALAAQLRLLLRAALTVQASERKMRRAAHWISGSKRRHSIASNGAELLGSSAMSGPTVNR
jgi:hypothetical protein